MTQLARFLVAAGLVLVAAGGIVYLASRLGITFGRLPGDIRIEGSNMTCVIALGTSLVLSILLTIALNIFVRLLK
jgi:hypothetical protein